MKMAQDTKRIFHSGGREWNEAPQRYGEWNDRTPEWKRREQMCQVNLRIVSSGCRRLRQADRRSDGNADLHPDDTTSGGKMHASLLKKITSAPFRQEKRPIFHLEFWPDFVLSS
ncbi:MAG: hypothetical protein ACI4MK_09300 [Aristaeellaceae bacterium]